MTESVAIRTLDERDERREMPLGRTDVARFPSGTVEGAPARSSSSRPETTLRKWQRDEQGRVDRLQNKFG